MGSRLTVVGLVALAVMVCAGPAQAAFELGRQCDTNGTGDGQFETPEGISVGQANDVYVGDTGNDRIQRFTADGTFLTKWGSFGSADGRFSRPIGVAVDPVGHVYVADSGNNRIQKFDANGVFLGKFGSQGSGDGQFQSPTGVAADQSGNVYVVDGGNHRIQKFGAAGNFITKWGTGPSSAPGSFNSPGGIAVDFAGNVYVTDTGNNRVQKFDSNGGFVTAWGSFGAGSGQFNTPFGITVETFGNLYVADQFNHRVQKSSTTGFFLEAFGTRGSGAGQFESPAGVAVDGSGLYVLDTFNHRVQKFTATAGAIVVQKDAQPDDPQDFDFTAGGGLTPATFQLDDDGANCNGLSSTRTFAVASGSGYSVTEDSTPGWDLAAATCSDGSAPSNIDVSGGEIVTCTFTNRKRGQIVVVQNSQPDDPQDFGFTTGGGLTPGSFMLDDDGADGNPLSNTQVIANVQPGSGYSVSQSTPAGWFPPDIICSDGSAPSNIQVAPGETVTCTFENLSPTAGRIRVVKDTVPNGARNFVFNASGGISPSSFQLDDDSNNTLPNNRSFIVAAGSGFSISEEAASGYTLASATCSDGSAVTNIDVSAGETVTCTFVNEENGSILVIKDSQPDDGQDFSFTTTGGLNPSTFVLDDDGNISGRSNQQRYQFIPPTSYSITETPTNGWELTSATCSDGSSPSNIDLDPAESITCTFINEKRYHVRPKGATPVLMPLVPAFEPCVSPNRMHGPPLSHPSCNPPVPLSGNLTVGGGNGDAQSAGHIRLAAIGAPGGADDSDIGITVVLTNVMTEPSLSDYAGELRASMAVRLTDRSVIGFPPVADSNTTRDFVFGFTVPCVATADTTLGGDCRLATTADAVMPGSAAEGTRAIWALNQMRVHDGGLDGDADTPGDNSLLAVQGVFVP